MQNYVKHWFALLVIKCEHNYGKFVDKYSISL